MTEETRRSSDNDLGTWVHSLDREVTVLGRSQAGMRSTIDGIEERMVRMDEGIDKLIDLQTAPKPITNVWPAIGVMATIFVAFITFIELRLDPTEKMQNALYTNAVKLDATVVTLGKAETRNNATLGHLQEQFKHLDMQHHDTQNRLRLVEIASAETDAALKEGRK